MIRWSFVGVVAKTVATFGLLRRADECSRWEAATEILIACLVCSRYSPDEGHIMAVCQIEVRA